MVFKLPTSSPKTLRRGRLAIVCSGKGKDPKAAPKKNVKVEYGNDWYKATREAAKPVAAGRQTREFYERYREANRLANNGKERKDLYTENWDGDVYKGSGFNILNLLIVLTVLVPVLGLIFAFKTYGILWG